MTATSVYVGLSWKAPCRVATTAPITLSGTQTIDGVTVVVGDRVLVKNQAAPADNGIWIVAAGTWTRALDATRDSDVVSGMATVVRHEGTANKDTLWELTTANPISVGSTGLTFAQLTGGGGGGGSGNAVPGYKYTFTSGTPGSGQLAFDEDSVMVLHATDADSVDRSADLNSLAGPFNSFIAVNTTASTYVYAYITDGSNDGTLFTITLYWVAGSDTWSDGDTILILFLPAGPFAPTSRHVDTSSPLTGGGELTGNRTIAINSSLVPYTPADASSWNGTPPATVWAALDRLAALAKTLNGGTGP